MKFLRLGRSSREEIPAGAPIFVDGKPGKFVETTNDGESWYKRDEDGEIDIAIEVVVAVDNTCYCTGSSGTCFMCDARERQRRS